MNDTATISPPEHRIQTSWRDAVLLHFRRRRWRGFYPLFRFLRPQGEIFLRTLYGATFQLRPEEYIDGAVLDEGFYESEILAALQPWLQPGQVFWDIGANIGLNCISAAVLAPGLVVHAFEPSPATVARLRTNIALNAVPVSVWPFALSDTDGEAPFFMDTTFNSGRSSLLATATEANPAVIPMRLARADTLVARGELPAPNLVKLDVEGAESSVLAGFGALLGATSLRAVVFETDSALLDDPQKCPAARQLLAAGFKLRALTRRENTGHPLGKFLAYRS